MPTEEEVKVLLDQYFIARHALLMERRSYYRSSNELKIKQIEKQFSDAMKALKEKREDK